MASTDPASIFQSVQQASLQAFAQLSGPTRHRRVVPLAWDRADGYGLAIALTRPKDEHVCQSYIARLRPAEAPEAPEVLLGYESPVDLADLSDVRRSASLMVISRNESRLASGAWVGALHCLLNSSVAELRADGRRVGIGVAGSAAVLWLGNPPTLTVRLWDGSEQTYGVEPI